MSNSLLQDVVNAATNRRSFLKKIGIAGAAVTAGAGLGALPAEAQTPTEVEILNFALNLEYLDSNFYTYALTGQSIAAFGVGISGKANPGNPSSGGTVTGAKKVTFSNNLVFTEEITEQLAADERAHVKLLRSALGSQAIAQPNIRLNALGFGFGNQSEFLKLGRIFEDVGLSAYAGSAGMLTTPEIKMTSARILGTEAEHVSTIRTQIARLNVATAPPLDGVDLLPPPSGPRTQFLSVNVADGLVPARTPGQVLFLAYGNLANATRGGFFPDGVNGAITRSSGPA